MIHLVVAIIVGVYALSVVVLLVYSLVILRLALTFRAFVKKNKATPPPALTHYPFVTIQLPLYNEKYVVARLLKCITEITYPSDKWEVQVLDDSSDDSAELTRSLVSSLRERGHNVIYIHRENRQGFKAGALKEGLALAKGELIAIFDADFLPPKDWLLQTVPHFNEPSVGALQTRWTHLNTAYSLLTQVQAFALDSHFTIEQVGRSEQHHFINFNGTAGIWRKQTIYDAGNWESDTLTEDLDLSYRAQLKNWKIKYLLDIESPAELPAVMSAARAQQFRWNKGGAENLVKNSKKLLQDPHLPLHTKLYGLFHLGNSSLFLVGLMISVLNAPMLYIRHYMPSIENIGGVFSFLAFGMGIFYYAYWQSYKYLHGGGWKCLWRYTVRFFQFYILVLGMSFHNALGVYEGLSGKKSEFIRTPKLNLFSQAQGFHQNEYLVRKVGITIIGEIFLLLYFIFGLVSAIGLQDIGMSFFHVLLVLGYAYVVVNSLLRT